MKKVKKIAGVIMVLSVICANLTGCGTNSSKDTVLSKSSAELSQSTKMVSSANEKSAQSSSAAIDSQVFSESEPVKIKEGIHIKKYFGDSACFKFETPDGLKIVTDPYQMYETVKPDIVTESHQHDDHTDVSTLKGSYELIKTAGSFSVKGVSITGYSGKHNKGDEKGTNIIYVFDINGIKIAHFGSQGELPDNETLNKIGKVDVLLIQGVDSLQMANSKMTVAECNTVIKTVSPKIVIPEHGTVSLGQSLSYEFGYPLKAGEDGVLVVTRKELDRIKKPIIYVF